MLAGSPRRSILVSQLLVHTDAPGPSTGNESRSRAELHRSEPPSSSGAAANSRASAPRQEIAPQGGILSFMALAIRCTYRRRSRGHPPADRKSTRLNSSHLVISYAV